MLRLYFFRLATIVSELYTKKYRIYELPSASKRFTNTRKITFETKQSLNFVGSLTCYREMLVSD